MAVQFLKYTPNNLLIQQGSDTLDISLSDCILCTPMGVPLAEGKLEGYVVQCPWHRSRYDVRSGEVVMPPAMRPEPACIRG